MVTITGSAGGDARPGDTVTLTVNGTEYSGTLDGDRRFTVDVSGQDLANDADRTIDAKISTTINGVTGQATASDAYVVDTTPPTFSSASTSSDGSTVALSFDESGTGLAGTTPTPSDFNVMKNGVPVPVIGVSVDPATQQVTLTLASPIESGDTVTVDYTPGGSKLEDVAGNPAEGFANKAVTNNAVDTKPTQAVMIDRVVDDAGTKSGDIASGGVTDDTAPLLIGSLSAPLNAGEVVSIYRDGTKVGEGTMTGDTSWQFEDSGLAHGGSYNYTARVEKGDKQGPVSEGYGLNIDTEVAISKPGDGNMSLVEKTQDVFDFAPTEPVTFSLGSADAAVFEIVDGKLRFRDPPNHAVPVDENGDNIYFVTVKAEDAVGNITEIPLRIEITRDPNAPRPPDVIP